MSYLQFKINPRIARVIEEEILLEHGLRLNIEQLLLKRAERIREQTERSERKSRN